MMQTLDSGALGRPLQILPIGSRVRHDSHSDESRVQRMPREPVLGFLLDQQIDESQPLCFVVGFGQQSAIPVVIKSRV